MNMLALYSPVKWIHVSAVLMSGCLFAWRGVMVQAGRERMAGRRGIRWLSYGIDSVLLIAGVVLVAILPHAMFSNGWLSAKLALLVVYIILGSLALKRARTQAWKRIFFVAALLVYVSMIGIARTHSPLGWFHGGLQ
ncbi:SirB2 family protein [Oleiagrimonas sp.]|jgi:uncharacterized membrane protein SirB2|uniref:SirB2 family protein n=1 Tax=Oleiagrimonas sp. TaxID=2010330 RepID=UPI002603F6B7|nr:SirB2 family protein [Oleiagrimonas sp.]MDA3914797.1 SirB2 family protein [Oleiagrimonas sp.]